MKFDTIVFDMDGVVIDSEVLYDAADSELFRRHNKVYNREEIALILTGMHFRDATGVINDRYNMEADLDNLVQERRQLLEDQYRNNLAYIPGFEVFHAKLTSLGFKSCIGTASSAELLAIAEERLTVSKKFGANIFKVADVGNKSKPDPAIYLYCAEKMGTVPEKCVVIEDAPKGIQAAKNAGMFAIGITTTFAADRLQEADLIISSYEALDINQFI